MIGLKEKYKKEVIPEMMKTFKYKSHMSVPKIEKVSVNIGFGKRISGKSSGDQKRIVSDVLGVLAQITGQHAVVTKARKSIAGFKLREGAPIGCAVTLRGKRMTDFLERLIHVTLPRSRDFQGLRETSFDKAGNLTIAIKEHISFPEILPEKTKIIFSLEITIVTTASSRKEGVSLLRLIGFPIKKIKKS